MLGLVYTGGRGEPHHSRSTSSSSSTPTHTHTYIHTLTAARLHSHCGLEKQLYCYGCRTVCISSSYFNSDELLHNEAPRHGGVGGAGPPAATLNIEGPVMLPAPLTSVPVTRRLTSAAIDSSNYDRK